MGTGSCPASSRRTLRLVSSERRAARVHPEEPPPTIMTSYEFIIHSHCYCSYCNTKRQSSIKLPAFYLLYFVKGDKRHVLHQEAESVDRLATSYCLLRF